jgi:hypothetical protein
MDTHCFDFDLAVETTEDGDLVRVLASPAGEAVAAFETPYTVREQEQFWQLMATGDAGLRGVERQHAIRQMGERLFQALFPSHIHLCFEESARLAYGQRVRLRIRLHLHGAPHVVDLPWEYLYNPRRQEFLALASHAPLVRYADLKQQIVPFTVTAPLRMLVVIANPGGQPLYDEDATWYAFVDKLDYLARGEKLVLERLMRPTVHELQRRLRRNQYHLLHFIGHGAYDGLAQDYLLLFEDEMGRTRPVNSQHLGALLHDHFPLRLVTVQACATAKPQRQNPYIGVAYQLMRRGLPAAVALHQPLPGTTALPFVDSLYRAIADLTPVDLAMTEARRAVWDAGQDPAWGAITLYLRVQESRLFKPAPAKGTQERPKPRQIRRYF